MQETERERVYKACIEAFYKIAVKVLKDHPKALEEFTCSWKKREYKRAYIPFMEIRDKNKLTKEEAKINKDFYGLFVN